MKTLFLSYFLASRPLAYIAIAFGLAIEGEAVFFAGMYLVHQGQLDLFDTLVASCIGVFAGDISWYYAGRPIRQFVSAHQGKFLHRCSRHGAQFLDMLLRERPRSTIILTKFTYGLHRITLLRVRDAGITFKRFIGMDLLAGSIWMASIVLISFVFSASLEPVKRYFKFTEISLIIGLLVFLILYQVISRLIVRFLKKEATE